MNALSIIHEFLRFNVIINKYEIRR